MRDALNLALAGAVAAAIATLSLAPVEGAAAPAPAFLPYLAHLAAYFLLAGALLLYFHDTPHGHVEAVVVAALAGAAVELGQAGVPGRTASLLDAAVNLAGASMILLDHRSRAVTRIVTAEDRMLARLARAGERR